MHRVVRNGTKAVAAALVLVVTTTGASVADDGGRAEAREVIEVIESVAPDFEQVPLVETEDGFEVSGSQEVEVKVPATSDEPVTLSSESGGEFSMGLPVGGTEGTLASDGTVVYERDGHVNVAVQATDDGVRVQTVLHSRKASERYQYTLPADAAVMELDDGGLAVFTGEGAEESVTIIKAPWAYDAAGAPVPTRYELTADGFTQVVAHAAGGFQYPIVADPQGLHGTNWFFGGPFAAVRLSISETVRVMQGGSAVAFVGVLVAWIPTPHTVTAGRIIQLLGGGFAAHAASARALNKCVEYRYYWAVRRAYPLYYSGGYCR